eukprot:gene22502-67277_t
MARGWWARNVTPPTCRPRKRIAMGCRQSSAAASCAALERECAGVIDALTALNLPLAEQRLQGRWCGGVLREALARLIAVVQRLAEPQPRCPAEHEWDHLGGEGWEGGARVGTRTFAHFLSVPPPSCAAAWWCRDCGAALCTTCCDRVHANRVAARHRFAPLPPALPCPLPAGPAARYAAHS